MLLGIGALPNPGGDGMEAPPMPPAEDIKESELQDATPVGEEVAKPEEEAPLEADVAEAVESERQEDGMEAPPMPPGAKDLAEDEERMAAEEDEEENEDEEEDPDMTDEELDERDRDEDDEDEELDEDVPEWVETEDEDQPEEEDAPEDKEEEIIPADEDTKEASDKLEEPVAPVSEIKAEV